MSLEVTQLVQNPQSDRQYFIEGKRGKDNLWIFEIPDSINHRARFYKLKYKPFDFNSNTDFEITFLSVIEGDSIIRNIFVYDKNMTPIKASYLYPQTDEWYHYFVGDSLLVDQATIVSDVFFVDIDNYKNTELEAIMGSSLFGIYNKYDEEEYQRDLQNTINVAEKYPYSRYLLSELANFKAVYNSGADIKKVFDKFTNTQDKDTKFYTDFINDFINFDPQNFHFENIKLKNSITGLDEFVIENSEKYTLIVFSASWCGPCHERIPLLKEIFSEKEDKLNIVYISIDEPKTIENWKNILVTNNIPWRSLSLLDDENGVMKKYNLPGVPYIFLIPPEGKGEVISLGTEQEKLGLYNILD